MFRSDAEERGAALRPDRPCVMIRKWTRVLVPRRLGNRRDAGLDGRTAVEEAPEDATRVRLWSPLARNRYPRTARQVPLTFRGDMPHQRLHPRYGPNGSCVLDRIRVSRDLAGRGR